MSRTTESLGAPKEASKLMRLLNICQNLLSDLLCITLLTHHHFQVGVFWIQFQLKFRESLNERFLWYNCITDKRKATLKKKHTKKHIKTFISSRNLKLVVGDVRLLPFSWTHRIDRTLHLGAV